jgi:hypothetical protein
MRAARQPVVYRVGATLSVMLRRWSVARMQAELCALEASAERAGTALACVYSSAAEFEAAQIDARRALRWRLPAIDATRLTLAATAVAALAALAVLAGVAAIGL